MQSRFVRNQLIIFTIASIVGVSVMLYSYLQVPTLLGIGKITVMVDLPSSGGLYRFSNVTYRGVQVGKVSEVQLIRGGARAVMTLNSSPKISADLTAEVRSISAVGEQYIDLLPRDSSPPYLHDGSVIPKEHTSIPQPVGPMLDRVSALLGSIPKDQLNTLVDRSFTAFDGAGYDLGSLLDSSADVSSAVNGVADQTKVLIDDTGPVLDSQIQSDDATRTWTRSLAGITDQLVDNDSDIRNITEAGPGALQEVSRLFNQLKPTLPVLLANLTSVGQVAVTYRAGLKQLLILLPPTLSYYQSSTPANNPTGIPLGDFRISSGDPPACTTGFLPASQWRSPADTTTLDTPDGLYCKLPQDSPIGVRGARNYPCMDRPGKRAPTVELCDSDQQYIPLAMRPHSLGPSPVDPNLIAQGVPVDARAEQNDRIYAPVEGTPLPPGALPAGTPPDASPTGPLPGPPPAPLPAEGPAPSAVPPPPDSVAPAAAPASATGDQAGGSSVAAATYDPATGHYVTAEGRGFTQSNLAADSAPESWKDLMLQHG